MQYRGREGCFVAMGDLYHRVIAVLVAVLMVASVGASLGSVAAATPIQGATQLDSCTTITDPGRYVLTQDIEDSTADVCIDIKASNVHFDGNGHTIDGNITHERFMEISRENPEQRPSKHVGVGVSVNDTESVSNVTITDVTTTNWVLGVLGEGVSDVTVREVTSQTNGAGIWIDGANNSVISASNGSDNYLTGVVLGANPGAGNNSLLNVTANQNGQTGVGLGGASDSIARNITAIGNGYHGFDVHGLENESVQNIVVADSNFSQSGHHAMFVAHVSSVTVVNTSVTGTQDTVPDFYPANISLPPSTGVLIVHSSEASFTDIDARNQSGWAYYAIDNATSSVRELTTDAGVVSFEGRDIGLGPTATAPMNASNPNTTTVGTGLTVVNTSPDAVIELEVAWRADSRQQGTEPAEEQADTAIFDGPLVVQVGPPTDPDADGRYEDVNGDGRLNVRDVVVLTVIETSYQQRDLELPDRQVAAFDFNEDGRFDERDIVALATEITAGHIP